jgi:hypothetical protein
VYKKHYPPALSDEVWRLDKIGKDGAFHKRLNQAGIQTVEDFLRLVVMDPQRLRNVISTTLLLAVFHNPVCCAVLDDSQSTNCTKYGSHKGS